MSWIPRHAANCVSKYKLMDDGRTPVVAPQSLKANGKSAAHGLTRSC